ncbi:MULTISPECIES: shikimate kinase [Sphingobacterium]|uniref:Shikimate kinase n=1 Tax=Sphingobacterium chuzhouense TaxID=1742264 RepID=A0ABR7XU10_9SPHI|nr:MULTISPECIES: shikimate kinase [Sphingobacterium]MBD1422269.1 shikimate kinase [Sphingobacterium chuzhouense]NGM67139.1 shikimate kinase [Sphingobacterium sp. SGR-19]
MDKPIFLIGFMGSGKTTLGRKLANHLNLKFIDLDHVIVERIGMSIPAYFTQYGEQKFREMESQLLKEQRGKRAVISTGGGSPCFFDNMEWILENGISIYLYLTPKALHNRLQQSNIASRPALQGLRDEALLQFIEEKLDERAPFYKQAHIHIDQLNTSLDTICQSIETYAENK